MFQILRKFIAPKPTWHALMGWQVLTYAEGDYWLSLQIEPMLHGPCKVYVPDATRWAAEAPAWAAMRRDEILGRLQDLAWNRDLCWAPNDITPFWPRHAHDPWDSALEGTSGGRQLLAMRLFDLDHPARMSKAQAKQAWCRATEAMCMQITGNVNLFQTEQIPGSVFQEVAIPALQRNPRARLVYADTRVQDAAAAEAAA